MKLILPPILAAIIFAALPCTATFGIETAAIAEYAKRSQAERPLAVAFAKAELARVRKTKQIDAAEIRQQEQLVSDLENPLKPYYGRALFRLSQAAVGDMGWVHEDVKVYEILSKDSFSIPIRKWASKSTGTFDGRLGGQMFGGGKSYVAGVVIVSGIPTNGMSEDSVTTVDALLIKTPTEFKPVDPSKYADKFTRKNELRTWTSKAGGHTTEAIFVRMDRGKAILVKPDGKAIDVDLEKLSDADHEYIRKFVSEQAKLVKSAKRQR